jgi:membrane protease YdiL (CAAX protease family)
MSPHPASRYLLFCRGGEKAEELVSKTHMEGSIESLEAVLPVDEEPLKRGRPIVAWVVIVLLVTLILVRGYIRTEERAESGEDRLGLTVMELQCRYIVGMAGYFGSQMTNAAEPLNAGTIDQRFRYIVVEGEISGPTKAKSLLRELDQKISERGVQLTPNQRAIQTILNGLYRDYANDRWGAPSLSASDRGLLQNDLGWFGRLALNPAGGPDPEAREAVLRQAKKTVWVFVGLFAGLIFLCLAGLIGLVVVLVLFLTGALRARFRSGSPYGGVYAETFAVWMALFILLSLGAAYVPAGEFQLLMQGIAMICSLSALVWPVLRGVPWTQVRQDLGWIWGARPAREPALGAAGYVMSLPVVAVAAIVMLIMLALWQRLVRTGGENPFAPTDQPAHPVVQYVSGSWWGPIQILLIACLVAPVVEETMFRGVLYRHMREASARFGSVLSIFLSGIVTSFIFAVIHPQGIFAVPLLMALAFGFSLIREWRETLLPCMVAHGLHNGLATLTMILALR